MTYTQQQIIDAFCEAQGYTGELPFGGTQTKAEFITAQKAKFQAERDAEIAQIPSVKDRMLEIAVSHLKEQEKLDELANNTTQF